MKKRNKIWKTLDSSIVFDCPWYRLRKDVVQLPNGIILNDYYVSELKDVVMVVAITKQNDIVMERQYRHGAKKVLLELPAGTFNSNEENPEDAVKRELMEETGYTSNNWVALGSLYEYPTKDSHSIYVYLARDAEKTDTTNLELSEDIEVINIPLNSVLSKVESNEIQVSGTIAAIYMALKKVNELM